MEHIAKFANLAKSKGDEVIILLEDLDAAGYARSGLALRGTARLRHLVQVASPIHVLKRGDDLREKSPDASVARFNPSIPESSPVFRAPAGAAVAPGYA